MTVCRIRAADASDVQAISTLVLSGSADGTGIEGSAAELNEWRLANASIALITRRVLDHYTRLLVAESTTEREPVGLFGTGFAELTSQGDAYIGGVYCSVRGQGVGRSIISELVRWSRGNGAVAIEMTVARHNEAMKRLATSLGFVMKEEFTADRFYAAGFFGKWFLDE